jgi:long-chain fatty acid transport protein
MLTLLCLLPAAEAAGYYTPGVGTRALSRGGAFVAGADDTTAQYYNPAALTRIDGGQAKLDFAGVHQQIYFDRADLEGEVFDPIENEAPPYPIPTIGLAQGFMDGRGVLAFGVYPPYAPLIEYPIDGAQRYNLVDSTVIEIVAGPTAAFEVIPGLSLGAGINYRWMLAGQQLFLTTALDSDDPVGDIGFEMEAKDTFTIGWNAGVLWEDPKNQRYAVGAMVRPPIKYEAKGFLAADFSNHAFYESGIIQTPNPRDEDITLNINMPLLVKVGALVRPIEGLEIEGAFVWQKWDVIEDITLTDVDMAIELDPDSGLGDSVAITDDVVLPANFNNAWSAHLGAEYDVHRLATVRVGGLYETSAIPAETQGVDLVDGKKAGYGLGGTLWLGQRWAVDAAWGQTFLFPRTITDSEVTQIYVNALSGEIGEGRVVGNGEVSSKVNIGSVALQGLWGKSLRVD